MLRVPSYLAPSSIHGVGVYTPISLAVGTVIWEFTPEVDLHLTEDELQAFPEPFQTRTRSYCYLDESGVYVLCGDNARFMNHSDEPNCDDSGPYLTLAARRIEAGEELTCDYRAFDVQSRREASAPAYVSSCGS